MPYHIAHRGWSENDPEENTKNAFRRAEVAGAHGVEFDVRWSEEQSKPVVCHYAWQEKNAESLEEVLSHLSSTSFSVLLLELKEYHLLLWEEVKRLLQQQNLVDKTIIFAFPKVAEQFPWNMREDMNLGIIALFPWTVRRYAKLKPAAILFGYDKRKWTQFFFRLVWWDALLRRLFRIHPDISFIIGVAQHEKHIAHLENLEGLFGYTVDKK